MRRFLTATFLTLVLATSAWGVYAPVTHAQLQFCDGDGHCYSTQAELDAATAAAAADLQTAAQSSTAVDPAAAGTPTPLPQNPPVGPGITGVMQWIMSLFAWLVGVAALTLQNAVYYTVVKMGSFVSGLTAIGTTWRILRDIGNIILIFGFLMIGIATIIDYDIYGWGKKALPKLLIAAVFLNFSLFFAEAVIDVGNLFAVQFYSQINGGTLPDPTASDSALTSIRNEGISNKIMAQVGLTNIYGGLQANTEVLKGTGSWIVGFMGIILFIVTAFVMFSLAFILIARFVILLFLIISAPIGFAGWAMPKLEKLAGDWWGALFEQTATAPVLLLLLYIALAVITDSSFLTGFGGVRSDWLGTLGVNPQLGGFAATLLSFLVAMGLLLVVVIVSKKMSAFGGDWATKAAGKLSFGAASLGMRATFGSAGNLLASKRMQSWARRGGISGLALKGTVLAGKGLRSSTYDVLNAPGVGAGLGALGINAGKGATLTAKQVHDAQYGVKPVKEWLQHSKEEREQAGREIDFKNAQADLAAGRITQAQHDAIVGPVVSKMSTKQLEELNGIKNGVDALVNNLSPQQFEALMKSDKLNDVQKGNIKDARYRSLTDAINRGSAPDVKKVLNSLSKGELEVIPASTLINPLVLSQLSDKQRETITDSKERTATEKNLVRNSSPVGSVEAVFDTTAGTPAAKAVAVAASAVFGSLTIQQVAKLKKDILRENAVAEKLTAAMLIQLADEKKLTGAEMTAIGNAIRASATASAAAKAYVTTGPGAAIWS